MVGRQNGVDLRHADLWWAEHTLGSVRLWRLLDDGSGIHKHRHVDGAGSLLSIEPEQPDEQNKHKPEEQKNLFHGNVSSLGGHRPVRYGTPGGLSRPTRQGVV